jgi:predicted adenylyl cyclase CyaB
MSDEKQKKVGTGFGVMILNSEGKILLGKRHENPDKADSAFRVSNVWTMPGGKLEYGESFEEGAIREVLEETGMKLKNPKVICINQDRNEFAHFITLGLFSNEFEGYPEVMEPEEITEWQWFDLNNLPENIYFPSAKVLENYKQQKFYLPPKNIEVEIRSFITKEKYGELIRLCEQNFEFVKEDFQETYYFDCEQDLRIQKNNQGSKIWLKKGKIHDDAREEIEIFTKEDNFQELEKLFNTLGHKVEIKWLRKRNQFNWNGTKVCLDYTKGYGYIIELEKISNEENKEKILGELKEKLYELGVEETPKEIFNEKYEYYKNNWRDLI